MTSTAEHYRAFAHTEARGTSPIYEEWAAGVAGDQTILDLLDDVPRPKRQANLLFASARSLGAATGEWEGFRDWLIANWSAVSARMLERATQTNEAARCATLLPALDAVEGQVALLEVGASAGLCLHPDRYSYDYVTTAGTVSIDPPDGRSSVVLECDFSGETLPRAVPDVVWRAGIDLNPLDVGDAEHVAWLDALIWPEHHRRRHTLAAATLVARANPASITRGNLLDELNRVAAEAPADATLVVFHTAVLMYLTPDDRERFVDMVTAMDCVWISNEGVGVLPDVTSRLPEAVAPGGDFILAVDGEPIARTSPHGFHYRSLQN